MASQLISAIYLTVPTPFDGSFYRGEGLVLKKPKSAYILGGRDGRCWVKVWLDRSSFVLILESNTGNHPRLNLSTW